jgi:hypothetical protein
MVDHPACAPRFSLECQGRAGAVVVKAEFYERNETTPKTWAPLMIRRFVTMAISGDVGLRLSKNLPGYLESINSRQRLQEQSRAL